MTSITILCENSVSLPGILGEHGLGIYVEHQGKKFLFDTGQGFTIIPNALALGIDLKSIEHVVLSHGHYDHTGGLLPLLSLRHQAEIICHPDVFLNRYRMLPLGDTEKLFSIGIPWTREYLEGRGASFNLKKEITEIMPGVFISGEVQRVTEFEQPDPFFKAEINGKMVVDPLLDDLSIAINTAAGWVVLLGCAHTGIINVLKHFQDKLGIDKFFAVIGGTHLDFANDRQLEGTIDYLEQIQVEKLGVCHCTGLINGAKLFQNFPSAFFFAPVGTRLDM